MSLSEWENSMSDSQTPQFETDAEFLQLIQPRDEKYVEELEEDIFDHGCHEAICVWGSILIDGHLRYSICRKWDIRFKYTPSLLPEP